MEQYNYEMYAFMLLANDRITKDEDILQNQDQNNEVIEKFTIHKGNTIVRHREVITDDPKSRPSINIQRFDFRGCYYYSKSPKRNSITVAFKKMNLPINQLINCGYNVALSLYGQKIDDNYNLLFGNINADAKAGILSKVFKDIFTELEKKELSREGILRLSYSVSIRCCQIIGRHIYDLFDNEVEFNSILVQTNEIPDSHKDIQTNLLASKVARTTENAIKLINDAKQRSMYVVEVGKSPFSLDNPPDIIVHGEIGQTIIIVEVEQVLYLAHQRKCVLRKSNLEILDFAPMSSFEFQKKKENHIVMCSQIQLQSMGKETVIESDAKVQKQFRRAMNINIETNLWLSSISHYREEFQQIYSECQSALLICDQLLYERRHLQLCKDAGLHNIPSPESMEFNPRRYGGISGTENKVLVNLLKTRIFGNYCMFHIATIHSSLPRTVDALRIMSEWKGVMGSVSPSESEVDCAAMVLKVADHRLKFNTLHYNERNYQQIKNISNKSNISALPSNKFSTDNTPSVEFNYRIDSTPPPEHLMNLNMLEKLKMFKKMSRSKQGGMIGQSVSKNRVSFRFDSPEAQEDLTNSKINYSSYESGGGGGISILKREYTSSLHYSTDKDNHDGDAITGLTESEIPKEKNESLEQVEEGGGAGGNLETHEINDNTIPFLPSAVLQPMNDNVNDDDDDEPNDVEDVEEDVFDTELKLLLFQVLHDMTTYVNSITGKFLSHLPSKSPLQSTRSSEDISPITPCPIPINLESSMSSFAKGDIDIPLDLSPEEKLAWFFISCPAIALYEKHLETLELRLREIPELFTSMESSFVDTTRHAGLISVNISRIDKKNYVQRTVSFDSMKSWEGNITKTNNNKFQIASSPLDTYGCDGRPFQPLLPGRDKVLHSQYNTMLVSKNNYQQPDLTATTTPTNTGTTSKETSGDPPPLPITLRGTTFWNYNSSLTIAESQLKLKESESTINKNNNTVEVAEPKEMKSNRKSTRQQQQQQRFQLQFNEQSLNKFTLSKAMSTSSFLCRRADLKDDASRPLEIVSALEFRLTSRNGKKVSPYALSFPIPRVEGDNYSQIAVDSRESDLASSFAEFRNDSMVSDSSMPIRARADTNSKGILSKSMSAIQSKKHIIKLRQNKSAHITANSLPQAQSLPTDEEEAEEEVEVDEDGVDFIQKCTGNSQSDVLSNAFRNKSMSSSQSSGDDNSSLDSLLLKDNDIPRRCKTTESARKAASNTAVNPDSETAIDLQYDVKYNIRQSVINPKTGQSEEIDDDEYFVGPLDIRPLRPSSAPWSGRRVYQYPSTVNETTIDLHTKFPTLTNAEGTTIKDRESIKSSDLAGTDLLLLDLPSEIFRTSTYDDPSLSDSRPYPLKHQKSKKGDMNLKELQHQPSLESYHSNTTVFSTRSKLQEKPPPKHVLSVAVRIPQASKIAISPMDSEAGRSSKKDVFRAFSRGLPRQLSRKISQVTVGSPGGGIGSVTVTKEGYTDHDKNLLVTNTPPVMSAEKWTALHSAQTVSSKIRIQSVVSQSPSRRTSAVVEDKNALTPGTGGGTNSNSGGNSPVVFAQGRSKELQQLRKHIEEIFLHNVEAGRFSLVESSLKKTPSLINARNKFGRDAMQIAARAGSVPLLELLYKLGGRLDSRGNTGDTLFHLATLNGHVAVLQWLVAKGLSPAVIDIQGQSAVHVAARRMEVEALQYLISLGLDDKQIDFEGKTPIQCVPEDASDHAEETRKILLNHFIDQTI